MKFKVEGLKKSIKDDQDEKKNKSRSKVKIR